MTGDIPHYVRSWAERLGKVAFLDLLPPTPLYFSSPYTIDRPPFQKSDLIPSIGAGLASNKLHVLLRYLSPETLGPTEHRRAYVVPNKKPTSIAEERAFEAGIKTWMASRMARHKYLRGGEWWGLQSSEHQIWSKFHSIRAAGKILRKESRTVKCSKL
jgi:hypothetical protein